jgi:hypothetical protein
MNKQEDGRPQSSPAKRVLKRRGRERWREARAEFCSQARSCCVSFVDYDPLTLSNFAAKTDALILLRGSWR